MNAAERIDAFIEWVSAHGFFLGFLTGAALVSILWML
jgi:hypothetical protein